MQPRLTDYDRDLINLIHAAQGDLQKVSYARDLRYYQVLCWSRQPHIAEALAEALAQRPAPAQPQPTAPSPSVAPTSHAQASDASTSVAPTNVEPTSDTATTPREPLTPREHAAASAPASTPRAHIKQRSTPRTQRVRHPRAERQRTLLALAAASLCTSVLGCTTSPEGSLFPPLHFSMSHPAPTNHVKAPANRPKDVELASQISPRRKTTQATTIPALAHEQLEHFGIDPKTEFGQRLSMLAQHLYSGHADMRMLWDTTVRELATLPRKDRVERFAAQKFLCYQLAKMLDTLQHPFRKTYQSLVPSTAQRLPKGPYPIFDNVTAIFSAKPVITRTATYIYACAEWVDEAFQGKEMMLEVYSRLLNPTNVSLANHIVDIEAGPYAHEYFAWNFNSGMAAVDAILSHLVGARDVILASRNVYGGTYQLMHDWYAKKSNLDVSVNFFDGYDVAAFITALDKVTAANADRIKEGRNVYVYIESPCNPHGYVLDVPGICKEAHKRGLTVICDSTVGTPFLHRPLQKTDILERPDFIIHSYTKDLSGHGSTTAGVVIGRNERMFMGKHDSMLGTAPDGSKRTYSWDETLFWNVYYVKGAFLDSDKAYEVINGMHTLEVRMLQKVVNTLTFTEFLQSHPDINVKSNAAPGNENSGVRERVMFQGFPAPLFTFDFEGKKGGSGSPSPTRATRPNIDRLTFERFFDCLDPIFGHQVSLGQPNTVVLCPAITSHSEMSEQALADAGISPTTVRVAVGAEDPRTLMAHLIKAAESTLDAAVPGFSKKFPSSEQCDAIYFKHYKAVHEKYMMSQPKMAELLA